MGMKKIRCDGCGKKRAKEQGYSLGIPHSRAATPGNKNPGYSRWHLILEGLDLRQRCSWCSKNYEHEFLRVPKETPIPEQAEITEFPVIVQGKIWSDWIMIRVPMGAFP